MVNSMNKTVSMWMAAVVVAAVAGFALGSNRNLNVRTPDLREKAAETMEEAKTEVASVNFVNLGEQNESGIVGLALLREDEGKVKVNLRVVGASDVSTLPAHIHMGNCPTPGDILYSLTNVVDGESETVLDTTAENIKKQYPLAINVHKSPTELQDYVACGNVTD